jgi:hypothetical protein
MVEIDDGTVQRSFEQDQSISRDGPPKQGALFSIQPSIAVSLPCKNSAVRM